MTMLDTLFGLVPAASRGQQWIATDFQLVNWGGYDGSHTVRLAPTATLLTGGSGSGKSTLMDAYIALLMPHTTPFNGASNGGVVGRPRGADQRNILSYARGKLDETRTSDGTRVRVLRGDGRDTWSAIAMTWIDQGGAAFTAVRAWYVPATARTLEDVTALRAVVDGPFDLSRLEAAAAQRFAKQAVTAAGLITFDTDRDFTARLHNTLGIGAAGGGAKAVSLLGRIQAGQQITTVDDLYKRMVLEEPETLGTAEAVVAHFDELAGTRARMVTAQQQVRALAPIRGHREAIAAAAERLTVIEAIGSVDDPSSPAALWRSERRLDLLRAVETEQRHGHQRAEALVREKDALIAAVEAERDGLEELLRASGGDRLETARRELRTSEGRLAEVTRQRERLDAALAILGAKAATSKQFADLADAARGALLDDGARAAARTAFAEAMAAKGEADKQVRAMETERASLARRRDNIPRHLHEARDLLAEAAGLTPEDLPFVGELVEVRTEFEPWREAFNLALGGFATTMLIDHGHLRAFRAAINSVRTGARLHYEGVHTDARDDVVLDDRTLPGRLDYRPTPFTPWLKRRLVDGHGHVCVDTPAELGQHKKAITITGQLAQGGRGAHGGQGRANVLGYSNTRLLARTAEQIDIARAALTRAVVAVDAAEAHLNEFDERRGAQRIIGDLTWDQVDVAAVEAERGRWAAIIDEVTGGNPEIGRLQAQVKAAKEKAARLREDLGRAKADRDALTEAWGGTGEEVDVEQDLLEAAREAGTVIEPAQRAYLDEQFEPAGAAGTHTAALARFDEALRRSATRLASDRAVAQEALGASRTALAQIFETFLDRWPNPNLAADPEGSYADFDRILEDLEANGLHELERDWRDSLLRLSGNDLTNLDSTLSRSVREIKDRIEPINLILEHLPFADADHRLRIDTQEHHSAVRARFRKDLRDVRGLIEKAGSDAEREGAYGRMSRLIDRMRPDAPDHADLIDVRNHVRVSAEKITAGTREHVALYDHIGEKSGGESQELVAFIVGAALRYQLGDAGAARPRYAPVFLDEAMIKADAHFTGRAIGAWRGLGFQLVIGAPNDKHGAIEPHVDAEYVILKDTRGRSWPKPAVGLPS